MASKGIQEWGKGAALPLLVLGGPWSTSTSAASASFRSGAAGCQGLPEHCPLLDQTASCVCSRHALGVLGTGCGKPAPGNKQLCFGLCLPPLCGRSRPPPLAARASKASRSPLSNPFMSPVPRWLLHWVDMRGQPRAGFRQQAVCSLHQQVSSLPPSFCLPPSLFLSRLAEDP